jgi:hypothetical protein
VRPPLAVILLILAVPLMGSDCYVAGRVGGPPSPPPDDVVDPPPVTGGGGGVIIVTSNAPGASDSTGEAARVEQRLVEAVLAVSVWTPPEHLGEAASSKDLDPKSIVPEQWEIDSMPAGVTSIPSAPAAVPEPTGLVLFASGLWVASRVGRAGRRWRSGFRGRDGSTE